MVLCFNGRFLSLTYSSKWAPSSVYPKRSKLS
jgi:hypothetical protein